MLFLLMKDKRDLFTSVAMRLKRSRRFGSEHSKDTKDLWGKFTSFWIKSLKIQNYLPWIFILRAKTMPQIKRKGQGQIWLSSPAKRLWSRGWKLHNILRTKNFNVPLYFQRYLKYSNNWRSLDIFEDFLVNKDWTLSSLAHFRSQRIFVLVYDPFS